MPAPLPGGARSAHDAALPLLGLAHTAPPQMPCLSCFPQNTFGFTTWLSYAGFWVGTGFTGILYCTGSFGEEADWPVKGTQCSVRAQGCERLGCTVVLGHCPAPRHLPATAPQAPIPARSPHARHPTTLQNILWGFLSLLFWLNTFGERPGRLAARAGCTRACRALARTHMGTHAPRPGAAQPPRSP